ncbi:rhamnogalacturonan acetylesterase [Pedobacter nanyangensis]|uniref:rhamnogalacturonan acetylesterase n=1 Tax=Pedobacter nanyangensis TaxID=1562389 RepID=UPI000DE34076|nr:rhamnogalacturonan acetylesterase [Pedobacter nanyangensis]
MKKMSKIFSATLCLLVCCSFIFQKDKITLYTIGDSTMSKANTTDNYPGRGWVQMIDTFFNGEINIVNQGASGRSSKSYRDEGHWHKVISRVKEGDYVFIQFGHNDAKPDSLRHTSPQTTFKENLRNYVREVQAKKANPILFTSIVRRNFDEKGKLIDTHGEYVTVVRDLAKEMGVSLIDLNKKTAELVEAMGPEESKKLYMYVDAGVTPKLPKGKKDDTHLCEAGALKVAELAVKGLREINSPLAKYLVL